MATRTNNRTALVQGSPIEAYLKSKDEGKQWVRVRNPPYKLGLRLPLPLGGSFFLFGPLETRRKSTTGVTHMSTAVCERIEASTHASTKHYMSRQEVAEYTG